MTILEIMAMALIAMAALISLYRLLFGPTNPDRIVATDALSLIATVVLILLALIFSSPLYLDIALVYAVLSFVGMVALARVIEAKIEDQSNDDSNSTGEQ
jgi:multicomponent Na+:H+ antiporter subunit F